MAQRILHQQLLGLDSHPRTPGQLDYSTVTDFAKLRGWSTSVPLSTAT